MTDLSQLTEYADHRSGRHSEGAVRLLLDVDGVINAYASPADMDFVTRVVVLEGYGYWVRIRPPVLAAIRAWNAHPGVDLRWCTTWQDGANRALAPEFDLPRLPVVQGDSVDGDWKRHAAEEALASGTPLIWCDDVHATWPLVADLSDYGTPALLIAPDPVIGLRSQHLTRIASFVEKHTGQPLPPDN